jgi:hypothetical protein
MCIEQLSVEWTEVSPTELKEEKLHTRVGKAPKASLQPAASDHPPPSQNA